MIQLAYHYKLFFLFSLASGQPEALNELISHGATLGVVEKNGATPLHLAAQVSAPISGQLLSFLFILFNMKE